MCVCVYNICVYIYIYIYIHITSMCTYVWLRTKRLPP